MEQSKSKKKVAHKQNPKNMTGRIIANEKSKAEVFYMVNGKIVRRHIKEDVKNRILHPVQANEKSIEIDSVAQEIRRGRLSRNILGNRNSNVVVESNNLNKRAIYVSVIDDKALIERTIQKPHKKGTLSNRALIKAIQIVKDKRRGE